MLRDGCGADVWQSLTWNDYGQDVCGYCDDGDDDDDA